ncbi:hypothetical protein [Alkalilimnicola sp. S0819]|uniref:hypothetical protein n=1 Tax=Alkalilimnicola sp. S0819 TaxID=2613922 RepID=UPI00186A10E9|nr:hypothetical protein [Alkalilimnicola sp. S0819]
MQAHLPTAAKGGVLDAIEALRRQGKSSNGLPNPHIARFPNVDPQFLALYRPD